jgi:transcriptional regulator with XRE-family HTH domain/DNA polymerase III delta prime subunit
MPESFRKPNEALRRAREERGWTQSEAAHALGCSLEAVQSWERGRRSRPGPRWRARLCEVYQRSPEELGLQPTPSLKTEQRPLQESHALLPATAPEHKDSSATSRGPVAFTLNREQAARFQQIGDKKRRRMLMNMWNMCIDGKLRGFLDHAAFIPLDLMVLSEEPNQSSRLEVREIMRLAHDLPAGTSITQVYDRADGELLILGEPGAGKSVLLLELARELLMRAEQNERYPMPVVFNLASWTAQQTSLDEWLVAELQTTYRMPEKVGQALVETDQLVVLLDGLDETSEESRPTCLKAIQAYQQKHPLVSLVLCCRTEKYYAQATHITFQQTICVKPLTRDQIDFYLASATCQHEAVKQAFQEDQELQEMCTNPLMLNIITRIYQSKGNAALALSGSIEMRRRQVFEIYVKYMLTRSGAETRYTPEQTMNWLMWLAGQMNKRSQTEFYIERMQPNWLPDDHSRQCYLHTIVRLVFGIQIIISAGIFAWLRGGKQGGTVGVGIGLLGRLGAGPGNSVLGWMAPGLGGGLEGGGSLGILFTLVSVLVVLLVDRGEMPIITAKALWSGLANGVRAGLAIGGIVGTLSAFIFSLSDGITDGLYRGLGTALFSGLLMGLMISLFVGLRRPMSQEYYVQFGHEEAFALKGRLIDRLLDTLIFGLAAALSNGGVYALLIGHLNPNVIAYGSIIGLFYGIAFGLGGGTNLIGGLGTEIKPAETVAWSWSSIGQTFLSNFGKGVMIGLFVMGCGIVALGCASGLFYGPAYGVRYGLVYGLIIGLVSAVASILTGMLRSGWSSQTLEEHQLLYPNEGMQRSLRNAAFAACLFGPLGGLASGLICGVAFGLIGGLPGWPTLSIGFALIFGIIFALQFVMLQGGIAYLQHYILRLYLWKAGFMPWRYAAFLDYATERVLLYKVRGGYMFFHRLLLDYFVTFDPTSDADGKA